MTSSLFDFRFGIDAHFDSATGFDMVLPSALVLTVIVKLLGWVLCAQTFHGCPPQKCKRTVAEMRRAVCDTPFGKQRPYNTSLVHAASNF